MANNIPTNAYRVYTGPGGKQMLVFIDGNGMSVDLIPDKRVANLQDGYYTRDFKLIRLSPKPKTAA